MKKHLLLLLFAILFPTALRAFETITENGIFYDISYNAYDKFFATVVAPTKGSYSGSISIPQSVWWSGMNRRVKAIRANAFRYSTSIGLTSISIPSSITSIPSGAALFCECTNLTSIIIDENNPTYDSRNNCNAIIITETNTLIAGCQESTIPNGVTIIGGSAFQNCSGLTSIIIPEGVTSIENSAFWNCTGLSSIIIPKSVSNIGDYVFSGCSGLTSVAIPQNMTSIGENAFSARSNLTDVYCYAENVPNTHGNAFDSSPIASATLHVPIASLEAYRTTAPWNGFGSIVAIDEDVNPETIEIATAEDLINFATRVNVGEASLCAVLTADIDLNGVAWTPIGNANTNYKGIFDGQGHTITGFNYTATADYNGLFGYINNAIIKDFSISGTLTSTYNHNGVVGNADGASIVSGIHSSLTINVSNCYAHTGGVVGGTGFNGHTLLVENCEYSGTLTHSGEGDCQAGILGYTKYGGVRNCIFSGTIIGENSMYGGILAYCKEQSFRGVQNCLSVGKIVAAEECTTAAAIIANWNGISTANVKNNYYCSQEGSTTTIAIGNKTQNCEAPVQVTAEQLANGEVCYALNGDQTEINWYQTLGEDEFPVPDNRHLAVKFIDGVYTNGIKYTITFDTNGGSPIESITQYPGTAITPPEAPTREGYTFMGWEPAIPETMPLGDMTVTAQWQINSYTLTYKVDGEDYKTYEVEYGSEIIPEPFPTREGHTFSGWSEIPATMPAHDVVVTGSFITNNYTLTYIVDGVVYKTYSVAYGAALVPEEAPMKEGYTFSGWTYIPATMPATDVVVMGSFTINSYTLTYMVDGEEYKTEPLVYGSEIIPEEEPTKEGYTFSGWSEIPETMPAGDVVITGSFTVNGYTLTYLVDGEVFKTDSIAYGTTITPEAEPSKEGYTFSGWVGLPTTMPAHDVTVTGSFTFASTPVNIFISNTGYATFYDSQYAYVLPKGLSAQVVINASNGKLTYRTIADGNASGIVPKGTAVMLASDGKASGIYTLTSTESSASYSGTNLLYGSDEATMTMGNGLHYKLSYGKSGTSWDDVFGWYWGAQDGAPFQIDEHKAWLVVPNGGTRAEGFTIDGDATEIISIASEEVGLDFYYDIQGRRISMPTKNGIYIKKGKKVVIK